MPDRFMWVDDRVLRGGAPTPEDLKMMKDRLGVGTIISLDGQSGLKIRPVCRRLGLKHEIIPLTDGHDPNVRVMQNKIKNLHNNAKGRVYVHCYHGKDRTGMTIAMYRMMHNGWPIEKALQEAYRIGMGRGLSPKVRQSYFSAVREFANGPSDDNSAQDIVENQRQNLLTENLTPAINDQSIPNFGRQSYPPLADAQKDHLNRPASKKIFFCGPEGSVLKTKQYWFADRSTAGKKGKGKLFSATISSNSNVVRYDSDPTKTLIQSALAKEADVVVFKNKYFFVIDPDALIDVEDSVIGEEDENDLALQIGQTSNQAEGVLADYISTPGGGSMPDGGGFAGFVQLPYSSQF